MAAVRRRPDRWTSRGGGRAVAVAGPATDGGVGGVGGGRCGGGDLLADDGAEGEDVVADLLDKFLGQIELGVFGLDLAKKLRNGDT